jgi:hypothetical protein
MGEGGGMMRSPSMRRLLPAALALLFALLVAACGSHGPRRAVSNAKDSTTYTAAPKQPPVPCASPSTGSAVPTGSATPGTTTWSGVFERVVVQADQSGAVKGTPVQHTRVTVVGTKPVTVAIPVTASRVHKKTKGSRPQVVDEQALVKLDPEGTAHQNLKSAFNHALPVKVSVTYTLDGKPIPKKHLGRTSGTLEIHYKLANVTSESVPTCFEGFDGQQQHLTVTEQIPIVASLSLIVPSNATSFAAPGASLSAGRKGVSVGWTASLFEPLGSTTQTFSMTMRMKHPSVPKISLYLFTVDPRVLQGSAPAKTAVAAGNAASEQAKLVASVQNQLDALQKRVSTLANGSSSTAPVQTTATTTRIVRSEPGRTTPVTAPSRSLSATDESDARAGGAQTLSGHAGKDSLADLNHSIASLVKSHAVLSHMAAALRALAVRVRKDALVVTTRLDEAVSQLEGPVQNAALEVQQLGQLQADLDSFSPDEKSSPAYAKLASDLQAAQSTAGQLQSSLEAAQQRVQAATAGLGQLEADLAPLETKAAQSGSAAAQAADSRLREDVTHARRTVIADVASLETQLRSAEAKYLAAKAAVAKAVAVRKAAVSKAVTQEKAAATRKEAKLEKSAATRVAAAQDAIAQAEASARRTAAETAQQVQQSVLASLAASQIELTKIDSQVNSALVDANESYARLLALNELALLNQLPGGNAPGATSQNGRFVYTIG